MVGKKSVTKDDRVHTEVASLIEALQDPELVRSIRELRAQYSADAVTLEELRETLDEELGEHSLGEELQRMRDGK